MTPGQNSTLNYDPGSEFHIELWSQSQVTIQRGIKTRGHNSTWNQDSWSQFNVKSWSGSQFNVESRPGSQFNIELRPGVTIQRGIMAPGQNFTFNIDPSHSSTLNCDPGSQLNVESWLGVTIQRGIKTRGHNSTGGQHFIRRRGRYTMTPVSGVEI